MLFYMMMSGSGCKQRPFSDFIRAACYALLYESLFHFSVVTTLLRASRERKCAQASMTAFMMTIKTYSHCSFEPKM